MLLQKAAQEEYLKEFRERFEGIKSGPCNDIKQSRLNILQKDLEEVFRIPHSGDVIKYRQDNPDVMKLYRSVVEMRDIK